MNYSRDCSNRASMANQGCFGGCILPFILLPFMIILAPVVIAAAVVTGKRK